jgi:tRNA1(Val) A37 N6-methylase TrmN6
MTGDAGRFEITEDSLLGGRVRFSQPAHGYRAAIDPVLLAACVPARDGETVLDLGAGAGAASLCLAARVPGCRVVGVERDAALVELANANARANGMADRLRFVVADVGAPLPADVGPAFEHAMANPPFLEQGRSDLRQPPSPLRQAATLESDVALAAWIETMSRAVRRRGRIALIHRADRLAHILRALAPLAGAITIFPLWPKAGRESRRVLVSARPGTNAPLRLSGGLVLHEESGGFTEAAAAILRDGAALGL